MSESTMLPQATEDVPPLLHSGRGGQGGEGLPPLTYAQSGVDYASLDPAKVLAQRAAAGTAGNLARWGLSEVAASRGESAYVWEEPDAYRAMVIEGLGTKNLVAEAVRPITGRTHYDALAQDTVAMIVNDIIVVGAAPQVVTAYWAVGDSGWFDDRERAADLVRGWAAACDACGATWGGGETPALSGVVTTGTIDLGGACVGVVRPKSRLVLGDRLAAGDAIVLLGSSGIHANGLTLARRIAARLPDGYGTDIGDGTGYGAALLAPTHLYARLVADVFEAGVDVHYMVNITGHGWRKIMRARRDLRYVLEVVPPVAPLFRFLVTHGGLTDDEAYGNLNMGAGFAVYVAERDAAAVVDVAARRGVPAWIAGRVESGPRAVVIEPLGITFEGERLAVRS
jgi:phosphoribosylformylglycinamidine cyclo-ligase